VTKLEILLGFSSVVTKSVCPALGNIMFRDGTSRMISSLESMAFGLHSSLDLKLESSAAFQIIVNFLADPKTTGYVLHLTTLA
jgi:hypothetical protein